MIFNTSLAHRLNGGKNHYMSRAIWLLWSLSHAYIHTHTHKARVGRCPTEWRLAWYGEGAFCWESNGIRVSPPTTCNQSWGRASFSAQLQSAIFSIGFVLFVPHYRLALNSAHSTSIERQEKNGRGLTIRKSQVENLRANERKWAGGRSNWSFKN